MEGGADAQPAAVAPGVGARRPAARPPLSHGTLGARRAPRADAQPPWRSTSSRGPNYLEGEIGERFNDAGSRRRVHVRQTGAYQDPPPVVPQPESIDGHGEKEAVVRTCGHTL